MPADRSKIMERVKAAKTSEEVDAIVEEMMKPATDLKEARASVQNLKIHSKDGREDRSNTAMSEGKEEPH